MRGGFPWGIGRRLAGVRANKSCMELTIREERPDDCRTVGELVEAAFRPLAFSDHTEHLLVARLRRSEAFVPGLSLVAEAEGRLVGHVLLTRLEVVAEDRSAATVLGVAPLSVLPGLQNRGIGSALLREAHRRAVRAGFGAALLVGHADYYPRFGYVPASRFGIRFPFDAPDACCLAAELVPGSLGGVHGTVRYPAAFFGETPEASLSSLPFPESDVPPDLLHGLFCGIPPSGFTPRPLRTGPCRRRRAGIPNPRESPRKRFRERCLRRDRLLRDRKSTRIPCNDTFSSFLCFN